eukprot:2194318-Pyramimonas_sp.AAC.1
MRLQMLQLLTVDFWFAWRPSRVIGHCHASRTCERLVRCDAVTANLRGRRLYLLGIWVQSTVDIGRQNVDSRTGQRLGVDARRRAVDSESTVCATP